jgi:hypothetical protein
VRDIHSRASKNFLCAPPGLPLQGGSSGSMRSHCSSVKVWRAWVILGKSGDYTALRSSWTFKKALSVQKSFLLAFEHPSGPQTFRTRPNEK